MGKNKKKENNDIPRKFLDILKFKQEYVHKSKNSKDKISNKPKLLPGENFKQFAKRIDDETRTLINKASQQNNKSRQKKIEYLKLKKVSKVKIKDVNKSEKNMFYEKVGKKGRGNEEGLVEKIPFGFQAQEPPKFSTLPKKRKEYVPKKHQLDLKEMEGDKNSQQKGDNKRDYELNPLLPPPPGRKQKLKNLNPNERLKILSERKKVIDIYRNLKIKKKKEILERNYAENAIGSNNNYLTDYENKQYIKKNEEVSFYQEEFEGLDGEDMFRKFEEF
ncbi:hypothetical protein HK099_007780 [Clydaea vesicula]|uniref:Uncharacterized protein n=1 Tax=Clydaea vesicula TaxID=447962 RepID=A0AAD5U586_9FUNG|nr:hypothetical protein HK099_007780 [Clydaea vesicula]KAJ3395916.1 hypothetical protein HDU92_004591 [Lobulomyces angularis]